MEIYSYWTLGTGVESLCKCSVYISLGAGGGGGGTLIVKLHGRDCTRHGWPLIHDYS